MAYGIPIRTVDFGGLSKGIGEGLDMMGKQNRAEALKAKQTGALSELLNLDKAGLAEFQSSVGEMESQDFMEGLTPKEREELAKLNIDIEQLKKQLADVEVGNLNSLGATQ
tara:strand:+ start:1941 stop:2273 length:333 start_codon:yes stop_codon:yes gene_type:complete